MTDGPAVTCLLTSHCKGRYLRTALGSVVTQTRQDLHVLVVDSGRWKGNPGLRAARETETVYDFYKDHPLVEWIFTEEPDDLKATKCPVGWATNQAIRAGLIRGKYMCTFYDDDRYLPNFMERMAGYLDLTPQAGAVWCSQFLATVDDDGNEDIFGARPADDVRYGASFDCRVDGAQIMWRTKLLDVIGDPWLPEEPATCYHSDGMFLDKLGVACGIVPNIPEFLLVHRYTPLSTYSPSPI